MKKKEEVQSAEPSLAELVKAMVQSEEGKSLLKAKNPQGIEDLTGEDGLVAQITRQFLQECLDAEMDDHLGTRSMTHLHMLVLKLMASVMAHINVNCGHQMA
ncbi:hypothetical protein FACS1894125_2960 [Actinomycetota bacterium]|nr:hypothetical protein FACS1894125_2960 [Actinomycetota bacterium]